MKTMASKEFGIIFTTICFCIGEVNMAYPACSPDWSEHDGFCYKMTATKTTFPVAQESCISSGGHVVSIHSAAEDAFVETLQDPLKPMWIGLQKVNNQRTWVDGSEFDFNHFTANMDLYQGNCMAKFPSWQNYEWTPSNCLSDYAYICKKKGEYPTWTNWGWWSVCNCTSSTQARQRSCKYSGGTIPSENCVGEDIQTKNCVCPPDTTSAVYVELYEGRFYPAIPNWEGEGRHVLECSRHCISNSECVLFQFSQSNGSCLLFDHTFDQSSVSVESAYWSLWQVVHR